MVWKVFANNTALTAEDMNDVILEQAVPTFADATARNNAITTPNAGQHCHLLSTKRTYYYDATAGWVELLGSNVSGFTGQQVLVGTSTARPGHAIGRMLYETDTKRTYVSTGSAWIRPGGVPVFTTLASRDAYFTAPVAGDQCVCLSTTMTHDGTAWRFWLSGYTTGTTDVNGFISWAHGGGQAPIDWGVSIPNQQTDAIAVVVKLINYFKDGTNLQIRAVRTDASTFLGGNPVYITWWARF